jgi:hypothetical protein
MLKPSIATRSSRSEQLVKLAQQCVALGRLPAGPAAPSPVCPEPTRSGAAVAEEPFSPSP